MDRSKEEVAGYSVEQRKDDEKFKNKSLHRLTKKLNKSLGFPKDTEFQWNVISTDGNPLDWKRMYQGKGNQIAITEFDDHIVSGEIYFYREAGGDNQKIAAYFPFCEFRLLEHLPKPGEIGFDKRCHHPTFDLNNVVFGNQTELNQAVVELFRGQI